MSKLKASFLVLVRHRQREINHRKQHEDEGLNQRDKNVQAQEDHRNATGTSEKKTSVTRSPANILA